MQKKKPDLQLKSFKLNSLLEITNAINNNFSSNQLFLLLKFILQNQLKIGKAMIYINSGRGWKVVMEYGLEEDEKELIDVDSLTHLYEITVLDLNKGQTLNAIDVVIPVHHKSSPLAFLLMGDIDNNEMKASPIIKHLPFIQTLLNIIAVAIENKRLVKEVIRQERMKKELELASQMQNMLFPSELPNNEFLEIAAIYQPHQQVGGDYYDFIQMDEEQSIFCMADVSGKGVSAALLMANFQAHLRALVDYKTSLTEIVEILNEKVNHNAKGEKFITFFIGRYNSSSKKLEYINAAHPPPVLVSDEVSVFLNSGCTGLGMFDIIPSIKEGSVEIESDSFLVCYTDGVIELEDDRGEVFDENHLAAWLEQADSSTMSEMNDALMIKLDSHRGSLPFQDDTALFSVRFR